MIYSTCIPCQSALGENALIETLPIGRRIAFDARTGRLWVVCQQCARWNLVPFESRRESIEAGEKLYRDSMQRMSTGEIGLATTREGTELVRIGEPLRPEMAAWRYGSQLSRGGGGTPRRLADRGRIWIHVAGATVVPAESPH